MKTIRNSLLYISIVGAFLALIYWLLSLGAQLEQGKNVNNAVPHTSEWSSFIDSILVNVEHPLALLLAQIFIIVLIAKLFGWICTKIGQPTVVGEMIAGIVLGPSLMGMYYPHFSARLFPKESLAHLQYLSQIGLILFMSIVGLELDMKLIRKKAYDALLISHASILVPFLLGVGLSYFMYNRFAPEGVQFVAFSLFIGISMSITAFPVLARMVQERNLQKTALGTLVITCAAVDDITVWCILAAVIALIKAGSLMSALFTILIALVYLFFMLKLVRPLVRQFSEASASRERISQSLLAISFLTLLVSAYTTEAIGIHALFGAFMAGAIMPENALFRERFIGKIEDIALIILLPLFFVFTGLRTQIGLINEIYLWQATSLIILIAIMGKFLGSALAARYVGQSWQSSLSIGALMNTRGLMELVVLNIGYDLGVLTPAVFSMLVLMALVTTFMTGPALNLINRLFRTKPEIEAYPERG